MNSNKKTVKIAQVLDNHLEGKVTELSRKIFAAIANKAIKAGFNGPFKVIKIAIGGDIEFDFFQTQPNIWNATYRDGRKTYRSEVKKTESGAALWSVVDSIGNLVGRGNFAPDNSYRRPMTKNLGWGDPFNKQYPEEIQKCIQAANSKLEELLSEQNVEVEQNIESPM